MSGQINWAKRVEFAEVAEALGVPTDQVMAMAEPRDRAIPSTVLYTPEPDSTLLWVGVLQRKLDGALVVLHTESRPGLWEQITEYAETGIGLDLEDLLGKSSHAETHEPGEPTA